MAKCTNCNCEYDEAYYQKKGVCMNCGAKIVRSIAQDNNAIRQQAVKERAAAKKKFEKVNSNTPKQYERSRNAALSQQTSNERSSNISSSVVGQRVNKQMQSGASSDPISSAQSTDEISNGSSLYEEDSFEGIDFAVIEDVSEKNSVSEQEADISSDVLLDNDPLFSQDEFCEDDVDDENEFCEDDVDDENEFCEDDVENEILLDQLNNSENLQISDSSQSEEYSSVIEYENCEEDDPSPLFSSINNHDEDFPDEDDSDSEPGNKHYSSCSEWLHDIFNKMQEGRIEELETDIPMNFNEDGFYNDTEPLEPPQADVIKPITIVKIIGAIIGLFLIIAGLIYYA